MRHGLEAMPIRDSFKPANDPTFDELDAALVLRASAAGPDVYQATPKTGPQCQNGDGILYGEACDIAASMLGMGHGAGTGMAGRCHWDAPPSKGIVTWRKMRHNPTVALALAAAKAPIKASQWTIEDEDGPAGAADLIEKYVMPLRPTLLGDGLRGIDYGWQPFELVWAMSPEGKLVPAKLKPLLPEKTKILEDEQTGQFLGLENGGVTLDANDSFVAYFGGEGGSMKGESRLENIREKAWWPWEQVLTRLSQYVTKAAGIVPILRYPVGTSDTSSGQTISNAIIAERLLNRVAMGGSVAMPTVLQPWAEEWMKRGQGFGDLSKLMAWELEFVEAANLHGAELLSVLTKFESLIVRGILSPERAILEGNNGTKAEAGVHADASISIAQDDGDQLVRLVNWHIVNRVLVANYGPEAAGTVCIESAPLIDDEKDMLRDLVTAILENPANTDLALSVLDLTSAMEQVGLPVIANADPAQALQDQQDAQDGQDGQHAPGSPQAVQASIFRAAAALRGIRLRKSA